MLHYWRIKNEKLFSSFSFLERKNLIFHNFFSLPFLLIVMHSGVDTIKDVLKTFRNVYLQNIINIWYTAVKVKGYSKSCIKILESQHKFNFLDPSQKKISFNFSSLLFYFSAIFKHSHSQ